jgi:hypothetical protein
LEREEAQTKAERCLLPLLIIMLLLLLIFHAAAAAAAAAACCGKKGRQSHCHTFFCHG